MSTAIDAKTPRKEKKDKRDKGKRRTIHDDQGPSSSNHNGISPDILPPNAEALTEVLDGFDYDTIENDDDLELYIIRAPSDVRIF